MEKSESKRIIIIGAYILIILAIGSAFYYFSAPKPTCYDGAQNQNEEGIDCGGACLKKCEIIPREKLSTVNAGFVESGVPGGYDLYAQIHNSNQMYGASSFKYEFIAKDSAGTEIANFSDDGFILPGETKYVVKNNLPMNIAPSTVELVIGETSWVEKNEFYEGPQLRIINKKYNLITSGIEYAEALGLLNNDSALDFSLINLEIILKNGNGKIVALNSTEMRTVKAGEGRDFRVFWPNKFPGEVASMEVQAEVNVFSSDSFVKQFFKQQRFQEL